MAREPQKTTVTVTLALLDKYMSLDDLLKTLNGLQERIAAEGIHDVYLALDYERGYYDDVDVTAKIEGKRTETDEEFSMRLANEARARANREEYDRREYERLKAKFEG